MTEEQKALFIEEYIELCKKHGLVDLKFEETVLDGNRINSYGYVTDNILFSDMSITLIVEKFAENYKKSLIELLTGRREEIERNA